MGDLSQYVGRKFCDLEPNGATFVDPAVFGERVVTPEDVARAFPRDLLGLINVAAVQNNLILDEEYSLMLDQP